MIVVHGHDSMRDVEEVNRRLIVAVVKVKRQREIMRRREDEEAKVWF